MKCFYCGEETVRGCDLCVECTEQLNEFHREYQLDEELNDKYYMTEDEMIADEYKEE